MTKPIAIIAGEPNSISSEIIFKCWKLRKKFKHKPFIIIGSIVAIIHDILIVISILMFFSYQFDINIIAAFLNLGGPLGL